MLHNALIKPRSIAVIGGSGHLNKPGGRILSNLLQGSFKGPLYVVNPGESEVQGVRSFPDVQDLPLCDLAILAIPARFCPPAIEILARQKETRAFIVLSAGFSEEGPSGKALEKEMTGIVNETGGTLIGPNCIGVINQYYQGVFTTPVPEAVPGGCDFISGSGATAVFIMEAGIPLGLGFASVFSVGNSAHTGVEEVLAWLDETHVPDVSAKVKLLYLENIEHPERLLKHARSLIRKGCRIAAIKSGTTGAGSRAASSHTGALASPDLAVDALFRKAGIVRCHSREELVTIAGVFQHALPEGNRIAVVSHAGGPAVMLTDALTEAGMSVPPITHPKAKELLEKLHPGASVNNPIDFLATGTAGQLGQIIDYCDRYFDEIDAMVVIFGSPGLFPVDDVYELLHERMNTSRKPIFPVLPSVMNAEAEIQAFRDRGRTYFPDEVRLGRALGKVWHTPGPGSADEKPAVAAINEIRRLIGDAGEGYLAPEAAQRLLDAAGISRAGEAVVKTKVEAVLKAEQFGFPVVMKVVGPLHKSDVGGVVLNITDSGRVAEEFERLIRIRDTKAILVQPMLKGLELYAGIKKEGDFGHLIFCGLGGIFVETLKDVSTALLPLEAGEASAMIRRLKAYPLIKGERGKEGVNEQAFHAALLKLSRLVEAAPEIQEMDLNPLLGNRHEVVAVDTRIRISKRQQPSKFSRP